LKAGNACSLHGIIEARWLHAGYAASPREAALRTH
jgi:hypothetical protein